MFDTHLNEKVFKNDDFFLDYIRLERIIHSLKREFNEVVIFVAVATESCGHYKPHLVLQEIK